MSADLKRQSYTFTHGVGQLCELYWRDVMAPRWQGDDMPWEAVPWAVIQPSRAPRRHTRREERDPLVSARFKQRLFNIAKHCLASSALKLNQQQQTNAFHKLLLIFYSNSFGFNSKRLRGITAYAFYTLSTTIAYCWDVMPCGLVKVY